MKLVDRPPETCYTQNRRKLPKRSLALLLVLALLFSISGSFSAQENDPLIVIEFEPIENAEFFELLKQENDDAADIVELTEPENADVAEFIGADLVEDASAVNPTAVVDLDWDENTNIADLREHNIMCGDLQLMYVTFLPAFGVGAGLEYDMMAGEARPVIFLPWWHTNPDAVPYMDAAYVNDWDVPGFEGTQWSSTNESVFRVQTFNVDHTWVVSRNEGTAFLRLALPGGVIVQLKIKVAPRPPFYPRPEGVFVTPNIVRMTAGQTVSATLSCLPEEGNNGKPLLVDWESRTEQEQERKQEQDQG